MNLVLDRMPDQSGLALKALASLRRKPGRAVELPRLEVKLEGVTFDGDRLAAYREICGFPANGAVPILYPQVHAFGLQAYMLAQPQFPLPLIGLVHLGNRVTQQRELQPDETFAVDAALTGHQETDRGLEFDIATHYRDGSGTAVWSAVATVLHRRKQPRDGRRKAAHAAEPLPLAEYKTVEAPADIGRRYGRISGDMNPIHLYPFTAKLLGFDRHIAHGMWSMARCCALLQGGLGAPPRELVVQFRQPLFLPGRAALRYGKSGEGFDFSLIGRDSGKTHLTGSLR